VNLDCLAKLKSFSGSEEKSSIIHIGSCLMPKRLTIYTCDVVNVVLGSDEYYFYCVTDEDYYTRSYILKAYTMSQNTLNIT